MPEKKRYIAVHGIEFGKLKGKPRVESGEAIPEGADPETLKDLLDHGDIEEVKSDGSAR